MLYQKAHHVIACLLSKKLKTSTLTENCGYHLYFSLRSPPPRLPLGIPTMTAIIEKQKARGGRWEEEKGESLSYSRPPSRRAPRAFFFFLPDYDTKESLSKGVFERRTSTGSEAFSLLTCLDDIKFVFLSFFTVIKAI